MNEFAFNGFKVPERIEPKMLVSATAANLYGWAALACVLFFDKFSNLGPVMSIACATVMVVAIEAAGGLISAAAHGRHRSWTYPQKYVPFFGGSVSIASTLYFSMLVSIVYFASR